jgi:hypothetical protein
MGDSVTALVKFMHAGSENVNSNSATGLYIKAEFRDLKPSAGVIIVSR